MRAAPRESVTLKVRLPVRILFRVPPIADGRAICELAYAIRLRAGVCVDVHKPKAAHSWRELLTEIGTIICGILVALALEQIVEAAHRGSEVREARAALREELRDNTAALTFGVQEDRCLLPKLDAFSAWARGGPKPSALNTILTEYGTSTWDTVKVSAVPHMPLHERRMFAAFYDTLANEKNVVDIQRSSALVLIGALERRRLNEADANRVLDAAATARLLTNFHLFNAAGLLRRAEELGVKSEPLTPIAKSEIAVLCSHAAAEPGLQTR